MATKTVKTKMYSIDRARTDKDKCPPQAQVILEALVSAGKPLSRTELVEACKPGIKTTQTVERIVSFYRPRLIEMGLMKEVVEETTVEIPEAPAKAAKADAPAAENSEAPAAKPKKGKKAKAAEAAPAPAVEGEPVAAEASAQ